MTQISKTSEVTEQAAPHPQVGEINRCIESIRRAETSVAFSSGGETWPVIDELLKTRADDSERDTPGKNQFQETEEASEPDSRMAGILELSNQEFKIIMMEMIRALLIKQTCSNRWTLKVDRWEF